MRHITHLLLILATSLLALTSCKKDISEALQPEASGAPYELYVVMPDELRGSALEDSLMAVFDYPMECMPTGESYFRVRWITPKNFNSPIIRIVGNVVLINIDPQAAAEPVVSLERDKYARNQLMVKMYAKTPEALAEYIPQLQEGLRRVFVRLELNRRVALYQKENNRTQGERLMKLQQVSMQIPPALSKPGIGQADSTFFWCTDDGMDKMSHLIVYSIPYTDQNVFSLEGATAVRDSVLKANIPSDGEGSYMTTNWNVIQPEYKALNVGGKYIGELRGLWRVENGLMAGPFVCHIRLDELNKRVVFAEGFCYYPREDKRMLIRNLEAALYTLKLPSDNLAPEVEITMEE